MQPQGGTGFADQCNKDHLLSRDGSMIALSHRTKEDNRSRIYMVPFEGGNPVLITRMVRRSFFKKKQKVFGDTG